MRRSLPLVLLSLLLALLVAACGGDGGGSLGSKDIATVGSEKITKDDLDAMMSRAKKSYEAEKRPFPKPGTRDFNLLQSQAISFLVQRAEFAEKASAMGIHISDEQVDKKIDSVKKQFYGGSDKRYKDELKKQGLTEDQARKEVRAYLISQAVAKKVTAKAHVSDAAIRAYYQQNRASYQQRESRDIRHILVNSKDKALADRLYDELRADHEKNFASLAKKYSKDPGSAGNGGRMTIARGQTVAPFDKTAFSLKTGQLSKPVKTVYGWHVIQALSAIKPASTTPLDKVKDSIRQQLETQKKNELMSAWVEDLKKQYCKANKIKYAPGYAPNPDPCATLSSTTTATK
jgi:parvulin-like peptidyl-prolyl isomerase